MAWIQVLLLKPNKIVLKGNKELSELQGEEPVQTSCIGFQVSSEEDDEDYESPLDILFKSFTKIPPLRFHDTMFFMNLTCLFS